MLMKQFKKITEFSFVRFCIIGGILFVIDASLLYLLINWLKYSPIVARLVSASCSITISWLLHRHYTFAPSYDRALNEYKRFVLTSIVGFIINLTTYVCLAKKWQIFWNYPVLALIIATAVSMNFSYFCMKKIVFLNRARKKLQP
jgi:putative flippase GtrA